jgi:predicted nucleic-acid-binding Zn-ribbon protein
MVIAFPPMGPGGTMLKIDDNAQATKDCARCGARAFYWRTAIVAGDPYSPRWNSPSSHRLPAWTCMNCGYIEPHERRSAAAGRA